MQSFSIVLTIVAIILIILKLFIYGPIVAILVTGGIATLVYGIGEHFHVEKIKHEKLSDYIHYLNSDYYFPLSTYSFNLSRALRHNDLEEDELMLKWCIYLIYEYQRCGQKLLESIGGKYLLPSIDGVILISKLSEKINNLLLDCFGEKLREVSYLDFSSFADFSDYLEKDCDILNKFKIWIEASKNRKELIVLTYLYSRILSFNTLQFYGGIYDEAKKKFKIKELYKQAKRLLDIYDKLDTINRNTEELREYVNKYVREYKPEDICEITVSKPILVFNNRIFGFVKFKDSYPWLIRVKVNKKGIEPLSYYIYSCKFEYIEDALEKSQKLKDELEDDLLDLLHLR